MKKYLFLLLIIVCHTQLFAKKYYSLLDRTREIRIISNQKSYEISPENIIHNSVRARVKRKHLIKNVEYKVDYTTNRIEFIKKLEPDIIVYVDYKVFPSELLLSYQKFKPEKYQNKQVSKKKKKFYSQQDDFGSSNLLISGSKSFSISLGNREDLNLDQSLYLQIDGELSENLSVKAQLSDNNSPITTTGTTKKITELDKMFIEVYSKDYAISFGDFNTKITNTEFANYDFRAEGVQATWKSNYNTRLAAAVSEGEFKSVTFYGKEGVQGPYYLTGKTSARTKVLTGTETVYLDGVKLNRGTDYFINYNEGSIQFTNKNLITETSYIMVNYEFTSEEYRNNIYFSKSLFPVWEDKFTLRASAIVKNDNKNNPLNYSFTDEDIEILKNAGDNPDSARVSGVDSVAAGQGNYIKVDNHYEYVGFDSTGNYLVAFNYVGAGKGSYVKSGYYSYEWRGENSGDYIPMIQLPLPQNRANYDIGAEINLGSMHLKSEAMLTNYDKNTFSNLDNQDNVGYAFNNQIDFSANLLSNLAAKSHIFHKYINKHFHSLARIGSSEQDFETAGFETQIDSVDFVKYGSNLNLISKDVFSNRFTLYREERKEFSDLMNLSNLFTLHPPKKCKLLPEITYKINKISQENSLTNNENKISRIVHDIKSVYDFGSISASGGYYKKKFKLENITNLGNRQMKYFVESKYQSDKFLLSAIYEREIIDSLHETQWQEYKQASTIKSNFTYFGENLSAEMDYSHRENHFFQGTNSRFDMLESNFSHRLFNGAIYNRMNYNIGNEETYEKVKELIFVGAGNGSYTYIDSVVVYQGPGEGDYEYEITTVGEATPITTVELNWNLNFDPGRTTLFDKTCLKNFIRKFTFSSEISIQEESDFPEKMDIYLLRDHALMDSSYTKYGYSNIKEQVWYQIRKNKIITSLWYEKTKKMDNRYEKVFDKLSSDKYYLGLDLYNLGNWNFKNNISYEDKISNYNTDGFLHSEDITFGSDVGYKFSYNFIISTDFIYTHEKGKQVNGSDEYRINSFVLEPNLIWNYGSKYRIMFNYMLQNNDRSGSDYLSNVLFNKRDGITTRVTLQLDYKFSKYITGFLNYRREKYPRTKVRNQLKLEVRADF